MTRKATVAAALGAVLLGLSFLPANTTAASGRKASETSASISQATSLVTICSQQDWSSKSLTCRRQTSQLDIEDLAYAHLRITAKPRFHSSFLTVRVLVGGTDNMFGTFQDVDVPVAPGGRFIVLQPLRVMSEACTGGSIAGLLASTAGMTFTISAFDGRIKLGTTVLFQAS